MDVYSLKQYIIDNPDYIELILEESGFHNIEYNSLRSEWRCARESGRNPTSVKINEKTLSAVCFSTNLKGDLITLVQEKLNTTFPKALKKIADIVGFKFNDKFEKPTLPFGGYYKNINSLRSEDDIDLETYSDDILTPYGTVPNMLFYEDGIHPLIQIKYGIGYDSVSGRITVPWKFTNGVVGIMGRLNKKEVSDMESKWMPILAFPKSKVLYGYVENYKSVQEKGLLFLGESEKFSLQLASKGLNVGMSLGGSFMSELQVNHIKSLYVKKSILMLDEGLEEEHSREIAKQLKFNNFFKNEVGYIFDRNNHYLPKGSKLAPSDLDKNSLKLLIKNCTVWI
jgi:DNA primase